MVGAGNSVALAVELGTEVGDGVAAAVGAKVGVVSEAIVGTGVAAAMVAGTAVGADVAEAPHATANRMTKTASPGAKRLPHINAMKNRPISYLSLIRNNPVEIRLSYLIN